MKLKFTLVGTIDIADDKIDITDPCYDKSTWCRTQKPIVPGKYDCYAGVGGNKAWGKRVYALIILVSGLDLDGKYDVQSVGTIGVDAGMAGFFVNKPDYSHDEWNQVCEYVFESDGLKRPKKFLIVDENSPFRCKGFFSESGIGDGEYVLYAINQHNKTVGYKLEF